MSKFTVVRTAPDNWDILGADGARQGFASTEDAAVDSALAFAGGHGHLVSLGPGIDPRALLRAALLRRYQK